MKTKNADAESVKLNDLLAGIISGNCKPIKIYRCSYCEDDSACGFDGECYDHSYDECHHPFGLEEARRLVASWNYCIGISTEELEKRFNSS